VHGVQSPIGKFPDAAGQLPIIGTIVANAIFYPRDCAMLRDLAVGRRKGNAMSNPRLHGLISLSSSMEDASGKDRVSDGGQFAS